MTSRFECNGNRQFLKINSIELGNETTISEDERKQQMRTSLSEVENCSEIN